VELLALGETPGGILLGLLGLSLRVHDQAVAHVHGNVLRLLTLLALHFTHRQILIGLLLLSLAFSRRVLRGSECLGREDLDVLSRLRPVHSSYSIKNRLTLSPGFLRRAHLLNEEDVVLVVNIVDVFVLSHVLGLNIHHLRTLLFAPHWLPQTKRRGPSPFVLQVHREAGVVEWLGPFAAAQRILNPIVVGVHLRTEASVAEAEEIMEGVLGAHWVFV
jgi:hypothetical protein